MLGSLRSEQAFKTSRSDETLESAETALKDALEKSDGLLRIFVHPYYHAHSRLVSPDLSTKLYEEQTKATRIQRAIENVLSSASDDKPPVLIMESVDNLGYAETRLHDLGTHNAFIFPTTVAYPQPYYEGIEDETAAWGEFRQCLTNLGVKKVLVGGMDLRIYEGDGHYPELSKQMENLKGITGYSLGACVGGVAGELAKAFTVEMSHLTTPDRISSIY